MYVAFLLLLLVLSHEYAQARLGMTANVAYRRTLTTIVMTERGMVDYLSQRKEVASP